MKPSPFEIKKAQCDFALGRIEKADSIHHKYIRKEGNKYIYENARVKTPFGHGTVVSVKRHPIDINHINEVKVNVNDKEHTLHPDQVIAEQHLFDEKEQKMFNEMVALSRTSGIPQNDRFKIDFNGNVLMTLINYERTLNEDQHSKVHYRNPIKEWTPEKAATVKKIVEIGEKLKPTLEKLSSFRDEASHQQHEESQKRLMNSKLFRREDFMGD